MTTPSDKYSSTDQVLRMVLAHFDKDGYRLCSEEFLCLVIQEARGALAALPEIGTRKGSAAFERLQDARDEAHRVAENGWPVAGRIINEACLAAENVINQLEQELGHAIRDRDARAREACTAEGRTGCSYARSGSGTNNAAGQAATSRTAASIAEGHPETPAPAAPATPRTDALRNSLDWSSDLNEHDAAIMDNILDAHAKLERELAEKEAERAKQHRAACDATSEAIHWRNVAQGRSPFAPVSASGSNWQHFDAAYAKACESSEPKDWMQAALFAQQVRNAVSTTGLSTEDAARLEAMTKATYSHVDGRDLLHQLQPNGAHHIDIVVRINGEDRRYDGDWLKTLTHARDGHNMGEYADNPKLRAHIEAARAAAGDSNAGEASGALSATGTTTKEKT